MKIKIVSDKLNMTESQIRYYERNKLIPKIARDVHGDRDFTDIDLKWLKFISQMRSANVSIKTLQRYVALFNEGDDTADTRLQLLSSELVKLDNQISLLETARNSLRKKVNFYNEHVFPKERQL